MIEGLEITKLQKIPNVNGDLFKIIRLDDECYKGFGELYISEVNKGLIKGWKKHLEMTLNLVVMKGQIKFVFFDDNASSRTFQQFHVLKVRASERLKICLSPCIFMAFQGIDEENMLINFADIVHSDSEGVRLELDQIDFNWEIL